MHSNPDAVQSMHMGTTHIQVLLMETSVTQKIIPLLQSKTETIQRNLISWTPAAWLTYGAIIPLILVIIQSLSPEIKYAYFILDTTSPHWPAIILSSYTHTDISHIANNIGMYLISLMMIFAFCTNPKLMHHTSVIILGVVPFITSAVTLQLSASLGQEFYSQGFSAISYAYAALGLYVFFCGVMPDTDALISGYSPSNLYRARKFVAIFLIIGAVVLVLACGLSIGGVTTSDGNFVNGPAHVTGFFAGILTASLVGLRLKTNDVLINYLFILCGTAMIVPYLLMLL